MGKKTLVIVESPGKIKKITSCLGKDYVVMASYGHIQDLAHGYIPSKESNYKPEYSTIPGKTRVVKDLRDAHKKCDDVLIAADADREGSAISYSIANVLKLKDAKRIIFTSITKAAINKAVANPTTIDYNMVQAQQGRRLLDRLVGFKLSPLLWKKVGRGTSAGRVQSPVLRLVCEKEETVKEFSSKKFFRVKGDFKMHTEEDGTESDSDDITISGTTLHEVQFDEDKIKNNTILKGEVAKIEDIEEMNELLETFHKSEFEVHGIYEKNSKRNPLPPFTTSTLLQDANGKFGFTSKKTMMVAQKLYEGGHITYMRTDSTLLSEDAMQQIKEYVVDKFGEKYYRGKQYKTKSKNSQEAHEAIRPTLIEHKKPVDDEDQLKLYSLIWKRTVASQMSPADIKTMHIQILQLDEYTEDYFVYYFERSYQEILFEGFLCVYNPDKEGDQENEDDIDELALPNKGDRMSIKQIVAKEEFSKPSPRFNEGSLIKKLKDMGIGRPSTFASMVSLLLDRKYIDKVNVKGEKKDIVILTMRGSTDKEPKIKEIAKQVMVGGERNRLVPTDIGIEITKFLTKEFADVMDYKFTAKLENDLDKIANGKKKMIKVIKTFDDVFTPKVDKLNEELGDMPDQARDNGRLLGKHPDTGWEIYATTAKFGPVVKMIPQNSSPQSSSRVDTKPKYAPIKKPLTLKKMTLEEAVKLLKYPHILGKHSKKQVVLQMGKFGLYIKYDDRAISFGRDHKFDEDNEPTLEDAISAITGKSKAQDENTITTVKDKKKEYNIRKGPYGAYISYKAGKKNAFRSIPKNIEPSEITLEQIKEIIKAPKKKFTEFKKGEAGFSAGG
jgi:DNA topoisomerase-1